LLVPELARLVPQYFAKKADSLDAGTVVVGQFLTTASTPLAVSPKWKK